VGGTKDATAEFIAGLGATVSPVAARAQQGALPMVGFITLGSIEGYGRYLLAFRAGLAHDDFDFRALLTSWQYRSASPEGISLAGWPLS
jgi:hypothetical protein